MYGRRFVFMHVKAKTISFGGLLLALSVIFMVLGSVIETSTLFLLAAASYFVGIVAREFGLKSSAVFWTAAVLLGFFLAPNKFYVLTFAAMGLYIWGREAVWNYLERRPRIGKRQALFTAAKYVIFNLIYLPSIFLFGEILFSGKVTGLLLFGAAVAGQAALFLYDRAYDYVQTSVWGKMRGRVL